ncbi:glycosyltransferase [Prevotella sp. E15-22]|uniref:glycosyltransferase n=1 Tax=Prevotella sp. E15-22 TaxID=2937774 RepID=UPI0020467AD7|nr:glycosyltransferase [Prevotella sp. E15-22]UPS43904.1 glycosyltransferase [Prevotella sp. E15-22]
MLDIYIVDVYDNRLTGYTTYKKHLSQIVVSLGYRCHNIILSSTYNYLCVENKDEMELIYVPMCHIKTTGTLLKLYIEDCKTNVFMQHFSTSYPTLSMLKQNFPKSKLVYVIHDFIWATYVMGNVELFKKIVRDNVEHKYKDIICSSYYDGVKSFNLVDKVVCLSSDTNNILNGFYKIDNCKIVQISNGLEDNSNTPIINDSLIRKRYNISEDDCVYLFVGRLTEQKGFFDLVRAFSLLKNDVKKTKLVCAGNYDSGIIKYIDSSIKNDVILLGVIDKNELYAWYKKSDFGIIPSFYEQCSYVAIEMMSFSLPIIALSGMGIKCMFNDNNSYYVENSDSNQRHVALYKKMKQAFYSGDFEKELIRNKSRINYEQNYTLEIMKENYEKKLFLPLYE